MKRRHDGQLSRITVHAKDGGSRGVRSGDDNAASDTEAGATRQADGNLAPLQQLRPRHLHLRVAAHPGARHTRGMDLTARWHAAVKHCPVIAIVRWPEPVDLVPVAAALSRGGVRLVEVTMNTPGACDAIKAVRAAKAASSAEDAEHAMIGAGTVLGVEDARRAVDAGAQFLVTPTVEEPVIRWAAEAGVPIASGAFTPTEALRAWRAGATAVKIFPAEDLGPRFIANVLAPLDMLRLVPTGHLTLDDLPDYFRAGATAVGVGPTLIDPGSVRRRDWPALTRAAQTWHDAATRARAAAH